MARRPKKRSEFLLSFRQVQCDCGIVRISGVTCADCGASPAPHEADPKLQRRRAAAVSAETLLRDGDPAIKPVKLEWKPLPLNTLLDVQHEILDWMEKLWPALNNAARDSTLLIKNVSYLLSIEQAFGKLFASGPGLTHLM
jgi:hypothetical protein